MNEQEMISGAKASIKTVMMDFIFEPLDERTLRCIESELAESLSDVIDIDIDFRVTAAMVNDEMEVVVYIPNEHEDGATKLTARYTDCPALSEEAMMENSESSRTATPQVVDKTADAVLFDLAMEVVDG